MGDDYSQREYSDRNDATLGPPRSIRTNQVGGGEQDVEMDKSLGRSLGGSSIGGKSTRGSMNISTSTNSNQTGGEGNDGTGGDGPSYKGGRAARRLHEEAVRRLVGDIQSKLDPKFQGDTSLKSSPEAHEWLVASTVATALEKGLDRDLLIDLEQEKRDNTNKISLICNDHSEAFLHSVARVAALGHPSSELSKGLQSAQAELDENTIGKMSKAANLWENARAAHTRAKALFIMVNACQKVAQYIEKAQTKARQGQPRAALDAVESARQALTSPMASLFYGSNIDSELLFYDVHHPDQHIDPNHPDHHEHKAARKLARLEETPFGRRATLMLPNIEREVLNSAKRQLNRWFMALREGEGLKCGRAVMRRVAHSIATGPGQLGLGGIVPPRGGSYLWRSKTADNLIARVNQSGRVARATRKGYWFERDAISEAKQIQANSKAPGVDRRAEAISAAFGYYRCWDSDITEHLLVEDSGGGGGSGADTGGGAGTANNRPGFFGGRGSGGRGPQGGRGPPGGAGRLGRGFGRGSLGFQSSQNSNQSRKLSGFDGVKKNVEDSRTSWSKLLVPELLFNEATSKNDDDMKYMSLPESVHPVRRAELAYDLLGKSEEFVLHYEQNRFGDTKISGDTGNLDSDPPNISINFNNDVDKKAKRSRLSSLTGDDVSVGSTRIFFSRRLPDYCANVIGFCAVEAALESGTFLDDDQQYFDAGAVPAERSNENGGGNKNNTNSSSISQNNTSTSTNNNGGGEGGSGMNGGIIGVGTSSSTKQAAKNADLVANAARLREASERYERELIRELGEIYRNRAKNATLAELVRSSCLMSSFRSAVRIVHPSSTTRRSDKELLAVGVDIIVNAVLKARDEQVSITNSIVSEDRKQPMKVKRKKKGKEAIKEDGGSETDINFSMLGVPEPEDVGIPFGIAKMIIQAAKGGTASTRNLGMSTHAAHKEAFHTFSSGVPMILKSIHARAIAIASFALHQEELGQTFHSPEKGSSKSGSASAGWVLDCVEECINVTAVGMKSSNSDGNIEKAVQVMANVLALQHSLPRLFGTLMRGMCIVGLIRSDEIQGTFNYAEKTLQNAERTCDTQVGSVYTTVFDICQKNIDQFMCQALSNKSDFWLPKTQRDTCNHYCDGIIEYVGIVFSALGAMDEKAKKGLAFSCLGHVSARLVTLLTAKASEPASNNGGIAPITKITPLGIKNMQLDVLALQKFADSTRHEKLRDQFLKLKDLTTALLDKDLPVLLLQENTPIRQQRYQYLEMGKVYNILEKYVGTGFGNKFLGTAVGGNTATQNSDMLIMDNKQVQQLLKVVKPQIIN